MLLSTQTDVTASRYGQAEAVRMIAAAGFDAADISMFDDPYNNWMYLDGFEEHVGEIKRAAKEAGIVLNQAHAPFPTMKDGDATFKILYRCYEKGLIVISLGANVLRIQPPLVITKEQLKKAFAIINESMADFREGKIDDSVLSFRAGW